MSDQERIELSAKQTPLPDLLDRVPEDIVLGIPGNEPVFPSYHNIPIGKLAHEAAAELRRLHAEVERLTRERDALLEALQDLMQQYKDQPECFMDWSKARAAIKAVEGEKE